MVVVNEDVKVGSAQLKKWQKIEYVLGLVSEDLEEQDVGCCAAGGGSAVSSKRNPSIPSGNNKLHCYSNPISTWAGETRRKLSRRFLLLSRVLQARICSHIALSVCFVSVYVVYLRGGFLPVRLNIILSPCVRMEIRVYEPTRKPRGLIFPTNQPFRPFSTQINSRSTR